MKTKKLVSLLLSALILSSGSSLGAFAAELAEEETAVDNYVSVVPEINELPEEDEESLKADEKPSYDLNGDGITDEKDAGILQNYLLGSGELSDALFQICDANKDGKVNVFDLIQIKEFIADEKDPQVTTTTVTTTVTTTSTTTTTTAATTTVTQAPVTTLAPVTPLPVTTAAAGETYTTKNVTSFLNIRSQTNVNASVLGTIPANAKFTVTSNNGTWAYAEYNGVKGWVNAAYIQKAASTPAPSTTSQTYTTKGVTSFLNIRSQANVNASVLGTIPANAKFTVTSNNGSWAYAEYNGVKGWVNAQYIQKVTTPVAPAADTYTTKNVTSFLNIRSQANVNATVLGTIPANAKFTVTSNNGSWAYAEYNGVKGWVNAAYIQKVTTPAVTTKPVTTTKAPTPSVTTTAAAETYTTKGVTDGLNIRAQANASATILGSIPANARFSVFSNNGTWAYIQYNNIKGWVSAVYIQKVGTTAATTTKAPTPPVTTTAAAETYTTKGVTDGLNIRSQANTNSTILGAIPANGRFTVFSNNGSWAYIQYNNIKGWVSAQYIQKVGGTAAVTTKAPAPAVTTVASYDTYTTKNVVSFLNIRNQANVNASVLGTIPANAKFKVTSNNGSWAYAEYNGVKGWVNAAYIQKVNTSSATTTAAPKPSATTTTAAAKTYTTKNVTSFLNIRSQANVNASVLGTIPANAKFNVTSNNGSWAYAEYNGVKGWVNAQYIQLVSNTTTPVTAETYTTKGVVTSLNIRNQANVNATILGTVPAGGTFNVTSNNGSWAYAEYNGVKGWVNADYIQKVTASNPSVMLNVMQFNQNPAYPTGCESAALYMLLKYYNVDVTMEKIVNALPKGNVPVMVNGRYVGANPENYFVGDPRNAWSFGVFNSPIATVANQFKTGALTRKGATVNDIISLINEKRPVIAWYCIDPSKGIDFSRSAWYDEITGELIRWPSGEHAVVVCGHSGDTLTYRDPYTGGSRTMLQSQFANVFNQMGGRIVYY